MASLAATLALVLCACAVGSSQAQRPSFNYSLNGDDWGLISPACSIGQSQSPINILDSNATVDPARLTALQISYPILSSYTVINKGQTIGVDLNNGTLTTPYQVYAVTKCYSVNGTQQRQCDRVGGNLALLETHFHVPSEHLHNGIQYPMEQHFEHVDPDTQQHATISLFYKLSDTEQDDPLVAKIFDNAPQTFNGNTTVRNAPLDIGGFLPNLANQSYWNYNGSLTAPPCDENVLLFVLEAPRSVSTRQLKQFQRGISSAGGSLYDARHAQPLHSRAVYYYPGTNTRNTTQTPK